jgi:hypothetical protein
LVALIFSLISQRTAKLFTCFRPLDAYTLDILGSCAGILAFMAISALRLPAWSWMLLFSLLFPLAMPPQRIARLLSVLLGCVAVFVIYQADTTLPGKPDFKGPHEVTWSPYQRIDYTEEIDREGSPPRLRVFANGLDHQEMQRTVERQEYQVPHSYRRDQKLPPFESVLIIGAGSGNDVAVALLNGAKHVDAVEIDPVIAGIGKRFNPYGAYRDPRVTVHIDDGRAFMTNTPRKYDLIVFALTDSLVKISSLSQLRLENYLFTQQSLKRAYELLNPGGNIVFYNFYRLPFVVHKIHDILGEATGQAPTVLLQERDFVMLMGEKPLVAIERSFVAQSGVALPSDDWPFLYLEQRGIPSLYLDAIALVVFVIVVLMVILHRSTAKLEQHRSPGLLQVKLAFVLMGVAFMLLETKSVIQFSLLFGTTWLNNSLIFLAVLLSLLAANWTVQMVGQRWLQRLWPIFLLLIVSCLATFVYPLGNLLQLESPTVRFVAAALLTFSPIYFANIIFSQKFQEQKIAEHIYGWNLLGATLGGVTEYLSMVLGYGALAAIVALLYCLVFALLKLSQANGEGGPVGTTALQG